MAKDSQKPPKKRPFKREKLLGAKVDPELAKLAKQKAKREGRPLARVIRAMITLWANDEVPEGWPPTLEQEDTRAQKRNKKK